MVADELAQLVERAELELAAGDVEAASERLLVIARQLPATQEQPAIVGRALWLIALISLTRGAPADFMRYAESAIDSLTRAGQGAAAEHARRLYDEIARRLDADLAVHGRGAIGLLAVLEAQLERTIERAETDGAWDGVDRDRAQLAQLVSAPAAGQQQPLARVLVGLGLDQVAAVALILLVPLSTSEALRRRALALIGDDPAAPGVPAGLVAGLAFAHLGAQQQVLQRLAPGAPLRRLGVVRSLASAAPELERVDVDPAVLWFLHDARAVDLPRAPGVHVVEPPAGAIPIDPLLDAAGDTARRWANISPAPPVLVVSGRRGAGKSTLVAAAAAETGRPFIAVDADAVPWESWDDTLRAVVRDGVLTDALVYLRCDGDVPPVSAALELDRLRLVIGVDPGDAAAMVAAVRSVRADVVLVRLAAVAEAALPQAWLRALADHGIDAIAVDQLGPLTRPGLVIGDLVDTVSEAVARAGVTDRAVDVGALVTVLGERTRAQLDDLAQPISGAAAPLVAARAVEAAARDLLRAEGEVDDWGLARVGSVVVARGAIAVVGGSASQRLAAVHHIAARVGAPAWRVDLADLCQHAVPAVRGYLESLAGAAGRAGALVYFDQGQALRPLAPGPIPNALAERLAEPTGPWIVGAERAVDVPSSIRRVLTTVVDLAAADEGAA